MEKNENMTAKAQAYAQEVLKEQLDAVANAYIKGYNDAMGNQFHKPIVHGLDKFVDLGLDSGTMWTTHPATWVSGANKFHSLGYYEALRYGIPTKEEFEEMFSRCRAKGNDCYIGPSSAVIQFFFGNHPHRRVWVKSDVVNDEALTCRINTDGRYEFERFFVGEMLRIMRIKNKNEE